MYVANYTDHQLFDPEQFEHRLTENSSSPLAVFREALKQADEILQQRFQANMNASELVRQRAWLIDCLLIRAWQNYTWDNETISLIAVGGYGRGELHPFSDVDLLILLNDDISEQNKENIELFLMFLWDIHLEVGHSVRTLQDCDQQAAQDISIATNLIEARLLTGNQALFEQMQQRVTADKIWSSQAFFEAKREEQLERYHKYDDTSYKLEPNIKEGPGALRDIHMVGWVAKRHFNATTLHDLVLHNFLTEEEYESLMEGQEFLWQVRCVLHYLAGRREDRLLFDYQRALATTFDYHDNEARLGVESFMKKYYRTIMQLDTLNDMLLQLFEEVILLADESNSAPIKLNKRFQVRNKFIEATHDKVFFHYPFALLEIFLLMMQSPQIKGIRASTIRLIHQYLHLIDEAFHRDLRSRSLFVEIVRQPEGLTRALRRMNRYGVLGAYIPAFGKILGQMQYDLFHVYTVDEHTLFVVRNLRRLSVPRFSHELPHCSKVMREIPKPELLYLSGLFHDIAKGRKGDHSELGEVDALNFCQAHGFSDYDSRLVAWLVRNHLMMSTTAQRYDISDPEVIVTFAKKLGDVAHLNYLYLLTVADIRGTSPTLWNGWKDSLLSNLYRSTKQLLEEGVEHSPRRDDLINTIKQEVYSLLSNVDVAAIEHLWSDLGEDYFLRSHIKDIAHETRAIIEHGEAEEPLVIERKATQSSTELVIYSVDRDYLFAEITYFLEQKSLTIVDALIVPSQRGHILCSFTILEENNTDISSHERVETILQELTNTLAEGQNTPFYPINRRLPRQLKHFPVPTCITFEQDIINEYTRVEVVTTDRAGVLSHIAQAFLTCGVLVQKAKIATFGTRVEDIFFITDKDGHALQSADQQDQLREQLYSSLEMDISIESKEINI